MKKLYFRAFSKFLAMSLFLGLSASSAYAQPQRSVSPALRPSSAPVPTHQVFLNSDAVLVWQDYIASGSNSNIEAAFVDITQGISPPVTWAVNQTDVFGLSAHADGNIYASWRSLDPFNSSNRINYWEIDRNNLNSILQQTMIPFPALGGTEILSEYIFTAEEGYSAALEFISDVNLSTRRLRHMPQ